MYATVNDILTLDIARDFRLLAGEKGLHRSISWIYVCQENEISPWVQGRELMILYGKGIRRDEESLGKIVEECDEKKLSGIIVLVGSFIDAVPPKMLAKADEYGIPLIEMPYNIPITKVTKAVADLLMQENRHIRPGGDILRDIIYGYEEDVRRQESDLANSGYTIRQYNYIIIVKLAERKDSSSPAADRQLGNMVSGVFGTNVLYMQNKRVVAFLSSDRDDLLDRCMENSKALLPEIDALLGQSGTVIGIGSRAADVCALKKSYQDAVNALKSIDIAGIPQRICSYDSMNNILKLLFGTSSSHLIEECFRPILEPLLQYDKAQDSELVRTLGAFLGSGCNATRAADSLYIHRNTMNYRMKLISDITGLDHSSIHDCYALMTAMYCYRFNALDHTKKI